VAIAAAWPERKGCGFMTIHVVQPGDYIGKIAKIYGVTPDMIITANQLKNPDNLVVGQTIVIPNYTTTHMVTHGQTMYSIASDYGISLTSLIASNPQIINPDMIQVGQTLFIPLGWEKLGTIYVSGYAYPFADLDVLRSIYPYLTYLNIFSYQVHADGSLSDLDDQKLIDSARAAKVAPIMVLTNLNENGGGFSSDLAHIILNDPVVQETLINNIFAVMEEKNYFGVDIDLEYIYPKDRQSFIDFIARMVAALRPLGYVVTIALAPKTSANQRGLLYESHAYKEIGALVDHVLLMTYEYGYMYGPAMAVAPVNEVKKVLNYAVSVIPSEKILLGMPNYGYDWTLPFVQGTAADLITNSEAVDIAALAGASISYNETAQAPYFNYYDNAGRQHEVWFDDARSLHARLQLIAEYELGGAGYWTVQNYYPANWLILSSMYYIIKVI
jgi:spore germination protein